MMLVEFYTGFYGIKTGKNERIVAGYTFFCTRRYELLEDGRCWE